MKRKALLVSYSGLGLGPTKYLKGVRRDVARCRKYLMSNRGGAWLRGEIEVIADKSLEEVRQRLKEIKSEHNHMVFTLYTGHGAYDESKNCHKLWISRNECIFDKDFKGLAERQISIFDCCSEIEPHATIDERVLMGEPIFEKVATESEWYRKAYEKICKACPPQSLFFYAAKKGGTAYDTPEGGLYTDCLLNRLETSETDMDFKQAHELACCSILSKLILKKNFKEIQVPFACASCNGPYLPGAIVPEKFNGM